jgi:hypothetical protein
MIIPFREGTDPHRGCLRACCDRPIEEARVEIRESKVEKKAAQGTEDHPGADERG